MAEKRPLCLYTGIIKELQTEDTLPGGGGTVTKVSVTTANGVSGSVATDTTTPAISITLGAITPTSVNGAYLYGDMGNANNFFGSLAGRYITAGGGRLNVFIGDNAGQAHSTGVSSVTVENTAVGMGAMGAVALTSGAQNTAVGYHALYSLSTGVCNVSVGDCALSPLTSGSNNTAVGFFSGVGNVTGSGNVMLGYFSGAYETGSDSFYVDDRDRTNTAGDKAKALLYGTFNATASSQTLTTNSAFTATYGINIPSGQTYKINNAAITTNDIADSADKRYCTDAQKVVIAATSGSNTGDQTLPVKCTGAEIVTGTDDAKFATAKALKDSGLLATLATTYKVLASNHDNGSPNPIAFSTALTSDNLTAGKTYHFKFRTIYRTNAYTTGVCFGVLFSSAPTAYSVNFMQPLANATNTAPQHSNQGASTTLATGIISTATGASATDNNLAYTCEIYGHVVANAQTTISLQIKSELVSTKVEVLAGTLLELKQVN